MSTPQAVRPGTRAVPTTTPSAPPCSRRRRPAPPDARAVALGGSAHTSAVPGRARLSAAGAASEGGVARRDEGERSAQDQLFTSVGYGIQEPTTGPGGITHEFPMERWYAVGQFWALNDVWLRIAQKQATDDGVTCSGDSGGPQFLGAGATETPIQVSITITGA